MGEQRFVITDRLWQRITPLPPGKATDRGITARGNHLFLEAVLWRVGTGAPWRDYPPASETEQSIPPLPAWATSGVMQRVFEVLSGDPWSTCP